MAERLAGQRQRVASGAHDDLSLGLEGAPTPSDSGRYVSLPQRQAIEERSGLSSELLQDDDSDGIESGRTNRDPTAWMTRIQITFATTRANVEIHEARAAVLLPFLLEAYRFIPAGPGTSLALA